VKLGSTVKTPETKRTLGGRGTGSRGLAGVGRRILTATWHMIKKNVDAMTSAPLASRPAPTGQADAA
jgi:hypothetical protein